MRSLHVLVALSVVACTPTYVIVGEDAPLGDAGLDAPPDAPLPREPSGGSECDQQDDCDGCARCSIAAFELCNGSALDCEDDPGCLALMGCLSACGDTACAQACGTAHASGIPLARSYTRCVVCDACPADCRSRTAVWCEEPPF
jgi:hypothetical protein